MRIAYSAVVGGSLEIPDEKVKRMSERDREIYINTIVGEAVADEASDNVEWEIDEED